MSDPNPPSDAVRGRERTDRFEPNRRSVLGAALGMLGWGALGPLRSACAAASPAGSAPADQPFLVLVDLDGGNDGLNTLVPQGLPSYLARRPTLGLQAAQTLALDTGPYGTEQYRMHPSLQGIAAAYRAGEIGIVQKVGYPEPDGSHDVSKRIWAAGHRHDLAGAKGWIARYAAIDAPTPLGAVSVGPGVPYAFAGSTTSPISVRSLASFRYYEDRAYRQDHARRVDLVRALLRGRDSEGARDAMLAGFDTSERIQAALTGYSSAVTYGGGAFSKRLQDIARMVQAGFESRIFYTTLRGFDTHAGQGTVTGTHANLLRELDTGLTDFVADLKAMGVWDRAVVMVFSEFGRRNYQNNSGGCDHGQGNFVMLTGGRVRCGLHGPAVVDADLREESLPYAVDFRTVFRELLVGHLGASDFDAVFPEAPSDGTALDLIV
jgi:uncharacterized protein (DUF1501 family)